MPFRTAGGVMILFIASDSQEREPFKPAEFLNTAKMLPSRFSYIFYIFLPAAPALYNQCRDNSNYLCSEVVDRDRKRSI